MIKKILILIILFFSMKTWASYLGPHLTFKIGYPYVLIQENVPRYGSDFVALNIGANMQFHLDDEHRIDITVDSSYSPRRAYFSHEKDSKETQGTTSLLTSFYSLSYVFPLTQVMGKNIKMSLGPALGIYTLDYQSIDENDQNISEINRVRVENFGGRVGFIFEGNNPTNFYEFAFIYSKQNTYTLIDNSTNEATQLDQSEMHHDRPVWVAMFNYGFLLF